MGELTLQLLNVINYKPLINGWFHHHFRSIGWPFESSHEHGHSEVQVGKAGEDWAEAAHHLVKLADDIHRVETKT